MASFVDPLIKLAPGMDGEEVNKGKAGKHGARTWGEVKPFVDSKDVGHGSPVFILVAPGRIDAKTSRTVVQYYTLDGTVALQAHGKRFRVFFVQWGVAVWAGHS